MIPGGRIAAIGVLMFAVGWFLAVRAPESVTAPLSAPVDGSTGAPRAIARRGPPALPYLLRPEATMLTIAAEGGPGDSVVSARGSARPRLARDPERYDMVSVDPAPRAAGGFAVALAVDPLATLEGFHALLGHLDGGGVLAISRFASEPALLRLAATARVALEQGGVTAPADHVFAAAERGLTTLLVKQTPFAPGEAALLERASAALGFAVLHSPSGAGAGPLAGLLRAERLGEAAAALPFDVLPVTDDRPFVNAHLRPADLLRRAVPGWAGPGDRALLLLRNVLAAAALLATLLLALPLLARRPLAGGPRIPALAAAGYFAALGLGFAVVTVVLVERLLLIVGRPAPAIALTLGALLLAGGVGSLRARGIAGWPAALRRRCALLTVGLLLAAVLLPAVVEAALPLPLPARLAVAAAAVATLGYFMGQPFPLGIALLRARDERLVPWAWSVSGALGAVGSVLALLLAVSVGYTEAMMTGPACCLVAAALGELL